MSDWRERILEDDAQLRTLLATTRRVAVLGIKTEAQADQPAFSVPKFLHDRGVEIVPVPVYYPDVKEILGRPVYRKLSDVPGPLDLVDVFRRPSDLAAHLPDLLARRPTAVWFQLGIRNDAVAEELAKAGIQVVQDRCLMVEWRRLGPKAEAGSR
jgi:predicted CoA-binding protein